MFYYVINVSVCANYFSSGFICGAGYPVGSFFFWGRGAQVRRYPGSAYLGHKPNVTWFKTLCAGGGNVTFVA